MIHDVAPWARIIPGANQRSKDTDECLHLNNGKISGGSGKTWYLLANPQDAATIEVAFLNGNETPTIESADANFQQLGIGLRGFHDFGISMQEQRAGVRMNGE